MAPKTAPFMKPIFLGILYVTDDDDDDDDDNDDDDDDDKKARTIRPFCRQKVP